MRSPVIAFSILAATVSPSLVSGAPTSPKVDTAIVHTTEAATHQIRELPNLPIMSGHGDGDDKNVPHIDGFDFLGGEKGEHSQSSNANTDPVHRTAAMKKAMEAAQQPAPVPAIKAAQQPAPVPAVKAAAAPPAVAKKSKRAGDQYTAGGNAYSGAASDSSGGSVVNEADEGGITNDDGSNVAGGAGSSFSGFSFGGNGNGHGPGGNAYTGATGASRGGSVINTSEGNGAGGSDIDNVGTANTAAGGGFSESGTAEGGNAARPPLPPNVPRGFQRRAGDSGTAGGNAYSGATSDVSGGSVVNEADDQGTVTNDGNTAGGAGTTFSGDADGGDGNGFGPGGNAYSGASGPAVGGSIFNSAGTVDNAAGSNIAGGGGISETGDANGGRA